MIVAVTGYARSGKNSVADVLNTEFGFRIDSFAAALKKAIYDLNPVVGRRWLFWRIRAQEAIRRYGAEEAKVRYPELRRLYQVMGTEVGRAWDENFWIDRTLGAVEPGVHVVIADARFPNEGSAVQAAGGKVIRVNRPGVGPLNDHPSETAVDLITPDFTIENDGTLEDLAVKVRDWFLVTW